MHNMIQKMLNKEVDGPFEYSELELEEFIQETDSVIWETICLLTRSKRERQGKCCQPSSSSVAQTVPTILYYLHSSVLY